MNLYIITVAAISVLIAILMLIILGRFGWLGYKKGAFFSTLPHNHTMLVELRGNPLRWIMHRADKDATVCALDEMVSRHVINTTQKNAIADKIVVREGGLCGLLVKLFNLHLTSLNPFATIRPIEVIPTGIKENIPADAKLSEHMKTADKRPEKFLRLAWPRTVFLSEVELIGQVRVSMLATGTKIRVWNLPKIWFEFSGKISEEVDGAMSAAFIQHFGNKTLLQFQTENMTARIDDKSLFKELQGKGLEAVGAWFEGPIEVSNWELGKEQDRLRLANLALEATQAEKKVTITEAEARAESIRLVGHAEADVTEVIGDRFANANQKLVTAFNGNVKEAAKVSVAREISKPGSNIRAIGGNSILNLGE